MKRNVITIVVALAIVGAILLVQRLDPERRTDAQIEASQETEEQLEQAETATQELENEADAATVEDVKDENVIKVKFACSNGDFVIEMHRDWAPLGVDQFLAAIADGVYDEARFFRVVPGFVVQFGMPGDADLGNKWRSKVIKDDPVLKPNVRGTVCFATSGKDSRTTQVFINLGDNRRLDDMGFTVFGNVTEGMDVVDKINPKYGEAPNQALIQRRGNIYLKDAFPDLDYIKKATILKPESK